jgi:hypothetical protein
MARVSLSGLSRRPHRARQRRCLLKGCGQWFQPTHPQCRYCSVACREAARGWRRWRAQQKYRVSPNGRDRRQEQARRYRQRGRSRPAPGAAPPAPAVCAAGVPPRPGAAGEGKRPVAKIDESPLGACDRPGCYVLFAAGSTYNPRRFCCALCRKALRCVLEREGRWRRRRHRGLKPSGRRRRWRARAP